MRILVSLVLFMLSIGWAMYNGLVKNDWESAREITGITVFFGLVWALIYYLIVS